MRSPISAAVNDTLLSNHFACGADRSMPTAISSSLWIFSRPSCNKACSLDITLSFGTPILLPSYFSLAPPVINTPVADSPAAANISKTGRPTPVWSIANSVPAGQLGQQPCDMLHDTDVGRTQRQALEVTAPEDRRVTHAAAARKGSKSSTSASSISSEAKALDALSTNSPQYSWPNSIGPSARRS
jgi:hypothetical protein